MRERDQVQYEIMTLDASPLNKTTAGRVMGRNRDINVAGIFYICSS